MFIQFYGWPEWIEEWILKMTSGCSVPLLSSCVTCINNWPFFKHCYIGVAPVFFCAFSSLRSCYRSEIPGNHECVRGHLLFLNPMVQSWQKHILTFVFHMIHIATLYHVMLLLVIYNHHYGMWMLRKTGASVMRPICMHGACVALLALQFKMQIGSHKALRVN